MKYIVTGATSCIGSAVCRFLLERGDTVVGIIRRHSPKERAFIEHCGGFGQLLTVQYADFADIERLAGALGTADVFLNFAWAGTSKEHRNSPEVQQKNADYALAAMRAAARLGCRLYIEAGSQAEYGWQDGELTTEDSPCNPFSEYGKAKLRAWQEGRELAKKLGISYAHLRIFSVYGEGESQQSITSLAIDRMSHGEPIELSPCTQLWNFLYRDDAAELICRLASAICAGKTQTIEVYNIASLDTRPLRCFVEEMRNAFCYGLQPHYGAVQPERLLSLNPAIDKILARVGRVDFTDFREGIVKEKEYKQI